MSQTDMTDLELGQQKVLILKNKNKPLLLKNHRAERLFHHFKTRTLVDSKCPKSHIFFGFALKL